MKTALLLGGLLLGGAVQAGSALAQGDVAQLRLRDEVVLDHPGATAAFSVDPAVAEVAVRDGKLAIVARGVGTTTISVVTATGVESFPVTVVPLPPNIVATDTHDKQRAFTEVASDYESSTQRLTSGLEMVDAGDARTVRAHAVNMTRIDDRTEGSDARTSFPSLSVEWRTERRELVAFDKTVEHSALTLDGVSVRGAHVRWDGLELHAGVTSPLLYQNLFLATDAELALGASYEIRRGRSALVPSVYSFPSDPTSGGTRGTMGSLMYRYRSADDRLSARGEVGWGGEPGAAADVSYEDDVHRAYVSARHQPRGFAALGIGRPLGSMIDATWTVQPGDRFGVDLAGTAARYDVGEQRQTVATAAVETRTKVGDHVTLSAGASAGRFAAMSTPAITSFTVPAGLHLTGKHLGLSALYRYQQNSARNRGGHGGRLTLRAKGSAFNASLFGDVQQEAATVELVLREEPELARLLAEQGLTVESADDLARLLRESDVLSQLGLGDGASVEFSPWRAQAGAELAWLPGGAHRQQLRARVLANRTQGVTALHDTVLASLSYARRLVPSVEITGAFSAWTRDDALMTGAHSWSVAAGVRVRVGAVPRLRWGSGDLDGVVVDDTGAPVAGVSITLDGGRVVTSDGGGRFRFGGVAGSHRLDAELSDDAYFVSGSRVTASPGDRVRFVIARSAARIAGTVRDDAGLGLANVTVAVHGARGSSSVITDGEGRYRFAGEAGAYTVEVRAETLAAGYDTSSLAPAPVKAVPGAPVTSDVTIPALRSIGGTAHGGCGPVRIVELDRTTQPDEQGRYVFRGLPAGTFTLEATLPDQTLRRTVELPASPTSLAVDF